MTADPDGLAARLDRLADELAADGALTEVHWREGLHAVPRHLFVPDVVWALDTAIDRTAEPARWLDLVYSDVPLITQIDDGHTDAAGFPDGAPYDRVHATCAVQRVPYAWVEQCRPGGVIVTPFQPPAGAGVLARLTVLPDGTAIGDFPSAASYMMLRSQRMPHLGSAAWAEPDSTAVPREVTRISPRLLTDIGPDPATCCTPPRTPISAGWRGAALARTGSASR